MQEQDKRAPRSRIYSLIKMLKVLPEISRFIKSKPSSEQYQHAKDTLETSLRNDGAQEEVVRLFGAIIDTLYTAKQEIQEDRETYYKIDLYLLGGMGVVSLVLLQILIPIGHPDVAASIALLSLVIALPFIGGFLLLGFLKEKYGASGYGSIPEKVAFIAELAGFISLAALLWHVWIWAGIVFLPFAFALFMFCNFYKLIVVSMKLWKPLPPPDTASEQQSDEN